jgi:hypothetical protein
MKLLLWPGNLAADLVGLPKGSDNRLILRMWTNIVFWGAAATLILALVMA